jgi:DNA helicase-2/ATP-dependent DNA helicase PcrA
LIVRSLGFDFIIHPQAGPGSGSLFLGLARPAEIPGIRVKIAQKPHKFLPRSELAGEIEWAKNRMVTASDYLEALDAEGHEPPIPAEMMHRVFDGYERRKERTGKIDFEDLLGYAVRLFDEEPAAAAEVRERFLAFTVDEYQDVNPLQQALLERWLGGRKEVCVVGDDYQTIYGFTGASPEWLLGLARRYPQATVVRLEENYRSTPQVLALANRLVPKLGGAEKTLHATRPEGPEPERRGFDSPEAEGAFVLERVRALHAEGVPYEEMAVLMRLNARSVDFEELFADAHVPFQGAALLARDGARQLLKGLRGAGFGSLAQEVGRVAREQGLVDPVPDKLGERELVRQADLARLCKLAEEFDDGSKTVEQWVEWLRARFGGGAQGGVHLLTLHRAKGLEFDAVFLPRVEEKELPCKPAMRVPSQLTEERRLLYVGITRARKHLALTWAGKPSRFLLELGVEAVAPVAERKARAEEPDSPTYRALKRWRLERSKVDEIPAYVVFHNSTLAEIAARQPRTIAELASVPGVGPAKLERYGRDVLAALAS